MSTDRFPSDQVDFTAVTIRLASPEDVRSWSKGEVTHAGFLKDAPERPHPLGLFSQRIFGPLLDWTCACLTDGKARYWGPDARGTVCPLCHVPIDRSLVRRQWMGHIELAAPVVHPWFLRGRPSPLALLLGVKASALEQVADCQAHVVFDPADSGLKKGEILSEERYGEERAKERQRGGRSFTSDTGGRAVKKLLQGLHLAELARELRAEWTTLVREEKKRGRQAELLARLRIIESLRDSANKPEWMVLECLPVLPPDLRPVRQLRGSGLRVSSDLNCFYQHIIEVNTRARTWAERRAPEVLVRHELRRLQTWVDGLLDNARRTGPGRKPLTGTSNRPLKSLTDLIAGKQGRFRQNLLGKRVDYSARAAIVCGPGLKLHQCGLPRPIAEELFRPLVLGRLARHLQRELELPWRDARLLAGVALKGSDADVRRAFAALKCPGGLRDADRLLHHKDSLIEEMLQAALRGHLVLLNRAPSLHRMNVQAFEPVLCGGKAIQIPPLVCEGFNADFDGDCMAVHLPLSNAAQVEAALLMRPVHNLLSPANGRPLVPSNEIVLGCAYLTARPEPPPASPPIFANPAEVLLAHAQGKLGVHAPVRVRLPGGTAVVTEVGTDRGTELLRVRIPAVRPEKLQIIESGASRFSPGQVVSLPEWHAEWRFLLEKQLAPERFPLAAPVWLRVDDPGDVFEPGEVVAGDDFYHECARAEAAHRRPPTAHPLEITDPGWVGDMLPSAGGVLRTTTGRVLLNQATGPDLPFYDLFATKKVLALIVADCVRLLGLQETALLLDRLKDVGFHAATRSGLSFLLEDLKEPSNKAAVVSATRQEIEEVRGRFKRGDISDRERYEQTVALWENAQAAIAAQIIGAMSTDTRDGRPYLNPIYLMAHAGARSQWEQIRQLAGMRGLMSRPSGPRPTVEYAITSSLRQGLSVFEYFLSAHGARKAGADKDALPDSGYLTRKLVDVAHHVVVSIHDCGTSSGLSVPLDDRIPGRVLFENVAGPVNPFHVKNVLLTPERLRRLQRAGVARVVLRTPLTCAAAGVCRLCYGSDLSTGQLVEIGTPVGVIAAQSIGEPGTQLALRTKHTGGVVTSHDLVSGLERVIALFDARPPRTAGESGLEELLRLHGPEEAQRYLLRELQSVYRGNGVTIDDRHFEVIIAQMFRRVEVVNAGDTGLLPQSLLDRAAFEAANQRLKECVKIVEAGASSFSPESLVDRQVFEQQCQALKAACKRLPVGVDPVPASCRIRLLGIKQAAMRSESFLSAASFQQTSKVLREAALASRRDPLTGLKENVILGRLIPAGTGFPPPPRK